MDLLIAHYHLRPGGIRRVIELATPEVVAASQGAIRRVVILTGERADAEWARHFEAELGPVPVEQVIVPAINYLSEQRVSAQVAKNIRGALETVFQERTGENTLAWMHNPSVGRNLLFTRELVRACEAKKIRLVMHHHDWWFDHRWARWPEMRRFGLRTLAAAATTVFPQSRHVVHATINRADLQPLKRLAPGSAAWLPNLTSRAALPEHGRVKAARRWLDQTMGVAAAPVWLLPCRLLRRKNMAEALLVTRWLRPEAWLVTTGGVSSAEEQAYADELRAAAKRHRWPVRLGVLAGASGAVPSVAELVAASEVVLLTSVQEGFGLPYLEAAAARRPLIARRLPNIAPDLDRFGFQFHQSYDEVLVDPAMFDFRAERRRQEKWFRNWCAILPQQYRALAGRPSLLENEAEPRPVAFSRLTLTAQLEVLAHPAEQSWAACVPLNPFLERWRERAALQGLKPSAWPRRAAAWLGGKAYANKFFELARQALVRAPSSRTASDIQDEFIRSKLAGRFLYPLLWPTK